MTEHAQVWYEVEVRLYKQQHWRRTTALVGGIEDGFSEPEAAQDFITLMREKSGDLLYEDADWRIVRCERRVSEKESDMATPIWLDDAICDAIAATHVGMYDGMTVKEHLESLLERVREASFDPEADALRAGIKAVITERYDGDFAPILPKLQALLEA